jgi:hypothetical protein
MAALGLISLHGKLSLFSKCGPVRGDGVIRTCDESAYLRIGAGFALKLAVLLNPIQYRYLRKVHWLTLYDSNARLDLWSAVSGHAGKPTKVSSVWIAPLRVTFNVANSVAHGCNKPGKLSFPGLSVTIREAYHCRDGRASEA